MIEKIFNSIFSQEFLMYHLNENLHDFSNKNYSMNNDKNISSLNKY